MAHRGPPRLYAAALRGRRHAAYASCASLVGPIATGPSLWAPRRGEVPPSRFPGAAAGLAAAATATLAAAQALRQPGASHVARCDGAPSPAAASIPGIVEAIPPNICLEKSTIRLYQFESCPFCRKVRGCLDYHRLPYQIIEVHPLSKAETKVIASDYKKVPILRIDGDDGSQVQLRDSKTIVHAILAERNPGVPSVCGYPEATPMTTGMWAASTAPEGESIEAAWLRWTDKVLVQCIVLNVYRNMTESAETFRYLLTHSSFPWFAQRSAAASGTVVMWGVAKVRKRKFKVEDERLALYEALEHFAAAVDRGGCQFLGGSKPGAVDFNVYGILRSAESCQTERDMLDNCKKILPWYNAMSELVGPSCAVNAGDVKRGS